MKAMYLHHSGFAIFGEGANLLIDYFAHPDGAALPEELFGETPLYVLASHGHHDHFSKEILELPKKCGAKLLLEEETGKSVSSSGVSMILLRPGSKFDDGVLRVDAYGSTDEGISFYIELDGVRLFHAGDLNDWHWQEESTEEEVAEMRGRFEAELAIIAKEHPAVDVLFFPIDPRMVSDIGRGAKAFMDAVACKTLVPMHFWGKFQPANGFAPEAAARGVRFVPLHHAGETFEL